MRYLIATVICIVLSPANADDGTAQGLHEQHCLDCHKPEIYTRPEHRVTSRERLSSQVRLCAQQLQLQWFDEEIEGVAAYLNREYYHFK